MLRRALLHVGIFLVSTAALAQQDSLDQLLGGSAQPPGKPAQPGPGATPDAQAATPASPSEAPSSGGGLPAGTAAGTAAGEPAAPANPPVEAESGETAATTQASAPAPHGKNRLVEEIVVTAEKREENLQDVPISVQAFSAGQLDAKGIENPKALMTVTPGMEYNTMAGYSLIYIRGVGTDAFIPSADADVATYIDGIYYPFGHGLAAALGSVQRVEVLKGPQGTLFGRNSNGGAINIITKQPGDGFVVSALAEKENYNTTNLRFFVNLPVTNSFAISLSGLSYGANSYYKQAASDGGRAGQLPREDSTGYALKIGWKPIDDLKVVLGYTYINTKGSDAMLFPPRNIKPLGQLLGVTQSPDYVTAADTPTYMNDTAEVETADIKYHLPWLDVRALGGNQNIKAPAEVDYDGSAEPLAGFEAIGQFAHVRTGELQFISNDFTWDWLKWLGGVYFINSSAGYDPLHFFVGEGLVSYLENPALLPGASGITSPLINLLSNVPGVGSLLGYANNGVTLSVRGILDTHSTAGFLQSTADLTNWLSLTLGGRYQVETRALAKSTSSVALDADSSSPNSELLLINFGTQTAHTTNFSPKAVLDFKFNDAQHAYLSYSKGFKSGTYNIIDIYEATQFIPPEVVTAYEVGYKSTLFDGALRFDGALFQNNIKDLQVQDISLTTGGAARFETAPSARIQGADFDLTWQLLPNLLPGLVFNGGGAYLRGRYTDYPNGAGYDDATGLFFGGSGLLINGGILPGRNFTGNTLVRTPTFSGNATLSQAFDLGSGSAEVAVDYYYNTGFYFSAQNVDRAKQGAYYELGAHASYLYQPWGLRATLYGKNITSTKYYAGLEDFDFAVASLLAPPAQYGLRLQWDF